MMLPSAIQWKGRDHQYRKRRVEPFMVKMTMKGKRFESIQGIAAAAAAQLKTLTKEDFQNCFRKWQEQWDKCVRS